MRVKQLEIQERKRQQLAKQLAEKEADKDFRIRYEVEYFDGDTRWLLPESLQILKEMGKITDANDSNNL